MQYRRLEFSEKYVAGRSWRFGGESPDGVSPDYETSNTTHLLTFPIGNGEASVFITFDFNKSGEGNPLFSGRTLFDETQKMVQFTLHEPAARIRTGSKAPQLPARFLLVDEVEKEDGPYEDEPAYPFHKTGGIPVFSKVFGSGIDRQCADIMRTHNHALQLAFPVGPNDCVMNVDWPFGETVFHIFSKRENGRFSFRYCWA